MNTYNLQRDTTSLSFITKISQFATTVVGLSRLIMAHLDHNVLFIPRSSLSSFISRRRRRSGLFQRDWEIIDVKGKDFVLAKFHREMFSYLKKKLNNKMYRTIVLPFYCVLKYVGMKDHVIVKKLMSRFYVHVLSPHEY
jgi:hypothetical protein